MPLTPAQRTTLAAHIRANTNTVTNVATGQPTAINALPDAGDNRQNIADWYNGIAQATDNQPIAAPLALWKPSMSIAQLNSAIDWTADPTGGASPSAGQITNLWLKWQSMCWGNQIDMTDPQVRQGIVSIWGSGTTTSVAIGAGGKQAGTRLECLLASAGVGGAAGLGPAAARVSQVFGYRISGPEVSDALLNG
ncbi:MAG: hypothetical protein ACJ72N_03545 [Labedaea sp.]